MGLIKDRKTFVSAVAAVVAVDTGVIGKVFGSPKTVATEIIEYDIATVDGVPPEYNSFRNTANVVTKDGKDTVRIAPVNFNNSITKEVIDADAVKFGQNEYGDGTVDPETESLLNGVGKLHLNALVGTKKLVYEALTTFKIADGYQGKNGTEDIVFPVPAANKEILDGTNHKYWDDADANPLEDMKRAYDAMKIKPDTVIMNATTYGLFVSNKNVLTNQYADGRAQNFFISDNIDPKADFYRAGRVVYQHVVLDVYVEKGSYQNGSGRSPYMPDGYAVYTGTGFGEFYYGGIPRATQGGITRIRAQFDVAEEIQTDPPVHKVIYRTAPLPVLKQAEGFYSQKVTA